MKITEASLRRIIAEAITGSDPQSLYDRYQELKSELGLHFDLLSRLGDDMYTELMDMLSSMHEQNSSYDGYRKFQPAVKEKPYNIFAQSAHKLWFGPGGRGGPLIFPLADISRDYKEYSDLKGQFKSVNATDQTDAVYGRKRTNIVHEPTGTVVKSSTDRKGSLGT